jgi:hypothetical protein
MTGRRPALKRAIVLLLLACLLPIGSSLALAGCGNDEKASKTEIAARLALAYGASKRYIYDPAQAGKFKSGATGRKAAIAKALVAAAFTARMMQKAKQEADQDPKFASFAKKISAAALSTGAITALLRSDQTGNPALFRGAFGSLESLVGQAKDLGIDVDTNKAVSGADLLKR